MLKSTINPNTINPADYKVPTSTPKPTEAIEKRPCSTCWTFLCVNLHLSETVWKSKQQPVCWACWSIGSWPRQRWCSKALPTKRVTSSATMDFTSLWTWPSTFSRQSPHENPSAGYKCWRWSRASLMKIDWTKSLAKLANSFLKLVTFHRFTRNSSVVEWFAIRTFTLAWNSPFIRKSFSEVVNCIFSIRKACMRSFVRKIFMDFMPESRIFKALT